MDNTQNTAAESSTTNPYQVPDSPIAIPSSLTPIIGYSHLGNFRDPSTLGKVVIIALIIESITSLADSWLLYQFVLQHNERITFEHYETLTKISIGTFLITGILFMLWTARIVRNGWAVRKPPLFMTISPRLAAGSFIIPIISWWYPYKALQQARKECGIPHSPIYLWWWFTWLITDIPVILSLFEVEADWLNYTSELLYLAAGVLAIIVVSKLTKHQSRMEEDGVPDPIG